jgi:hypothetical protein
MLQFWKSWFDCEDCEALLIEYCAESCHNIHFQFHEKTLKKAKCYYLLIVIARKDNLFSVSK